MDKIFYYLRKKYKYYPETAKKRCTTTDLLFESRIKGIWKEMNNIYNQDFVWESLLQDYIDGGYIRCRKPWIEVDFVYMPLHIEAHQHWILVEFDIMKRRLIVLNSLRNERFDRDCIKEVIIFSILLPHLLKSRKFSDGRSDLCWGKDKTKKLDIGIVKNLPQQDNG